MSPVTADFRWVIDSSQNAEQKAEPFSFVYGPNEIIRPDITDLAEYFILNGEEVIRIHHGSYMPPGWGVGFTFDTPIDLSSYNHVEVVLSFSPPTEPATKQLGDFKIHIKDNSNNYEYLFKPGQNYSLPDEYAWASGWPNTFIFDTYIDGSGQWNGGSFNSNVVTYLVLGIGSLHIDYSGTALSTLKPNSYIYLHSIKFY